MPVLRKTFSLLTATLIILTGCSAQPQSSVQSSSDDSRVNADTIEISVLRESFDKIPEKIKSPDIQNIDFSNTKFSFIEADSVSVLSLSPLSGKTAGELYDFFFNAVDELFPETYSDSEKEYEIRFIDGNEINTGDDYPYNYPDKTQYQNIGKQVSPWLTIDNENSFADMINGCIRTFDNGALVNYDKSDRSPAMYFMIQGNHPIVYYTTDLSSEKTYKLTDGEMSIAAASDYVNNYLSGIKLSPYENIATPRAVGVKVADIGNGCYGYSFTVAPSYNGIMFDCADARENDMTIRKESNDYDTRQYLSNIGTADMISTGEIHHFLNIAFPYGIESGESATKIIPLENAAETVSDFFSESMNLKARSVSAVYLPIPDENGDYTTAVPGWKFLLSSGERFYHVIVNMLTEEVYVYVQIIETGLEYD